MDEPTAHSPFERLRALLKRAGTLHGPGADLARVDLSLAQLTVLHWVGNSPGCHISEIAEGLGLTAPTVSVGVRRLAKIGWLECRPDIRDKRAICVYLSEMGEQLRNEVMQNQKEEINRLLGRLSSEEQTQLVQLLEKMLSSRGHEKSLPKRKG